MDFKEYSRQIASGNREAFLDFCRQYKDVVYQSAFARLGDEEDARRASRNIFYNVYEQLRDSAPPQGSFYTWLDSLVAAECEKWMSPTPQESFSPSRRKIVEQESVQQGSPDAVGLASSPKEESPEPQLFFQASSKPAPPSYQRNTRPPRSQNREIFDAAFPEKKKKRKRKRHPFLSALVTFLLICIALILAWALVGVLMRLNILPLHDLGYSWFNANIYPLF